MSASEEHCKGPVSRDILGREGAPFESAHANKHILYIYAHTHALGGIN